MGSNPQVLHAKHCDASAINQRSVVCDAAARNDFSSRTPLVAAQVNIPGKVLSTIAEEGSTGLQVIEKAAVENGGGVAKLYYPQFGQDELVAVVVGDSILVKAEVGKLMQADFSQFGDRAEEVRQRCIEAARTRDNGGIHVFIGNDGIPIYADEHGNIDHFQNLYELKITRDVHELTLTEERTIFDPRTITEMQTFSSPGLLRPFSVQELRDGHGSIGGSSYAWETPEQKLSIFIISKDDGSLKSFSMTDLEPNNRKNAEDFIRNPNIPQNSLLQTHFDGSSYYVPTMNASLYLCNDSPGTQQTPANTIFPDQQTCSYTDMPPLPNATFVAEVSIIIRLLMNPAERKLWGKLYGLPDDEECAKIHETRKSATEEIRAQKQKGHDPDSLDKSDTGPSAFGLMIPKTIMKKPKEHDKKQEPAALPSFDRVREQHNTVPKDDDPTSFTVSDSKPPQSKSKLRDAKTRKIKRQKKERTRQSASSRTKNDKIAKKIKRKLKQPKAHAKSRANLFLAERLRQIKITLEKQNRKQKEENNTCRKHKNRQKVEPLTQDKKKTSVKSGKPLVKVLETSMTGGLSRKHKIAWMLADKKKTKKSKKVTCSQNW